MATSIYAFLEGAELSKIKMTNLDGSQQDLTPMLILPRCCETPSLRLGPKDRCADNLSMTFTCATCGHGFGRFSWKQV